MNPKYTSIIDALLTHADRKPQDVAFTFSSSDQKASITWQELYSRAQTLATIIATQAKSGDRALLIYAPGIEFISAFLACAMAQVIAIPCFPPNTASLTEKLNAIILDAKPTLALHDSNLHSVDNINSIDTSGIVSNSEAHFVSTIKKDETVFLQYSSGSTGDPKGVMINHENIVANIHHIASVCGANETTRGLCWMPHTHDMGLIGHILSCIYLGYFLYLIPPSQMVRHPFSILLLLKEERLDSLGMPNFACELCIKRIKPEQIEQLDLSHLKTVIVGAEPINETVLKEFADKFSSIGFKSSMFLSAYGLAETTLIASAQRGLVSHTLKDQKIVSCGQAVETLKIVHPDTFTECANGVTGEIWLSGKSVAKGYWNKLDLTKQIFQNKLPYDHRHYLRTGDLGYMQNGNLYVCGRLKEMMIIAGEKHFPQDIETTILSADKQLEQQDCVVFSINDKNTEQLVAIVKIQRSTDNETQEKLASSIRKCVMKQHQLVIKDIIFASNTAPRTTSGKKQRLYCKKLHESRQLENYFKLVSAEQSAILVYQ